MTWNTAETERVDITSRIVSTPEEARQLAEVNVRTWCAVGYLEGAGYYWYDWVKEAPQPRGECIATRAPWNVWHEHDYLGVLSIGNSGITGAMWSIEITKDADGLFTIPPYRFEKRRLVEVDERIRASNPNERRRR